MRDWRLDDVALLELECLIERLDVVAHLLDSLLCEVVSIDDDTSGCCGILSMCHQCRSIHCYQYVAPIALMCDSLSVEVDLEARNTRYSALRSANFGRVVREGKYSITRKCGTLRENVADHLHAISRISRKTNYNTHLIFYYSFNS